MYKLTQTVAEFYRYELIWRRLTTAFEHRLGNEEGFNFRRKRDEKAYRQVVEPDAGGGVSQFCSFCWTESHTQDLCCEKCQAFAHL